MDLDPNPQILAQIQDLASQIRDLDFQSRYLDFQIQIWKSKSVIWKSKSGIWHPKSQIWTSKSWIWTSRSRFGGPNPTDTKGCRARKHPTQSLSQTTRTKRFWKSGFLKMHTSAYITPGAIYLARPACLTCESRGVWGVPNSKYLNVGNGMNTEITSITKYPVNKYHAISTQMMFALYGTWEALVWDKILLRGVRLIFQILKNYIFEF